MCGRFTFSLGAESGREAETLGSVEKLVSRAKRGVAKWRAGHSLLEQGTFWKENLKDHTAPTTRA